MTKKNPSILPLITVCFFVVVLALSLFNISLYLNKTGKNFWGESIHRQVSSKTTATQLQGDIDFWIQFLDKHPTYQEGYIELGRLYIKTGLYDQAKKVLGLAQNLNPNTQNLKGAIEALENFKVTFPQ